MRTSVLVVSAFAAGIGLASAGYSMASVPVPTSVTVCFPERGAIQVPVNGSCPSGTRPVQSAGIASTTELANQVRALERQFVRDHHVDIRVDAFKSNNNTAGKAQVAVNANYVSGGSTVLVTLQTGPVTTQHALKVNGYLNVYENIEVDCPAGQTLKVNASGRTIFGDPLVANQSTYTCPA